MTQTEKRTLAETTDLGIGMLVGEAEDGTYQLVGPVTTILEARDIASNDMRLRRDRLEQGNDPICPERYVVWARGFGGEYGVVAEIDAN